MDVWILWHIPEGGDSEEYMLIGVYSSQEAALAAVDRLANKPGFRDHPELVDDTDLPGFMIVQYRLDEDNWPEGYRTEPLDEGGVASLTEICDSTRAALLEFRRAEAFFRAQPSEWTRPQLVAAAVALLTAGVDHESVAALAGDDTAEWREVQRDLDRVVQDLALSPLSESDAVRLSLAEIVTDIQDGRLDVWEGLDRIQRIRTTAPAEAVGDEQHELGAMAVEYLSERGQPFGYSEADIVPSLAWYLERAGSRDIYQR